MLFKTYTYQDVEAAIARSNGVYLKDLKAGNGSNSRDYRAEGKSPYRTGTGHVYAHVATYTKRLPENDKEMKKIASGQGGKSLWQNRRTAISACLELLNNDPDVQKWLKDFDRPGSKASKRSDPIDIKDRPLTGEYYGYEAGSTVLKKATKGAINIFGIAGDLIIYSTYPTLLTVFQEPDLDLGSLFG